MVERLLAVLLLTMAIWTPTSDGNGTSLAVDDYGRTGSGYGSDALDSDNPEIIASDDTEVALNFFSTGVHAYRKWTGGTDEWRFIGVVLERTAGSLGPGAPGGLAEVRIKKRFLLEAINDYSGGSAPLIQIAGPGVTASFAKNILRMTLVSGSGTGSVWRFDADWEEYATGNGQTASSANIPYADLEVNTDRDILYRVQGVTAGQTDFSGAIQDGSILVEMDGVEYINATGIDPYIHWQSGTPSVRDTFRRIGLGFAGLMGPIWPISISDEETADPVDEYEPIDNVSEPCCDDGGITGTIPVVNPYGPYNPGPSSTTCVGGGTVPTAADLTDTEDWRTLAGPTPNMLCELHATMHPDTLGSTTYRWADQGLDLPAEPAFVEGRVRRGGWSEIRRAMALPDQYPEVSRAGVTIDEQDALIRTLLDTDSTAYLVAREWVSWLISEVGRKASTAMRVAFRGVVSGLNPGPGRTYTIEAEDQITAPGGIFNQDKLVPQAVIDYDFFGPGGDSGSDIHPVRFGGENAGQLLRGAHKDLIGTPIPIIGGICSDRGALSIDAQSAEKGAVPLIWVRDCYVEPHLDQIWGELLVCIGEVAGIEDVFASDVGYDGPTSESPPPPARPSRRIKINTTAGVDLLCPGMTGWPFAENYRERTVGSRTLRYTAIYLRGPRMEEHRLGILLATANVCGPMGMNDQVIDQAGPFMQWFYNEHVALNDGQGYRSGGYHTLATYASDATVPYLQPTTFADFQTYTMDRLGDSVGYRVLNFQLREQIRLGELEKRFMQDFEVSLPFNHHGQKMLRWIDDLADPTVGTPYRERIEIDEPLPPYHDAHDEIENLVIFRYHYDYDVREWRREPEELRDENSIEAHKGILEGGKRRVDGQPATPYDVWSTADEATVRDVFARRLLRKRKAPRYQQIPSDLAALHDEIGDQILLTHSRGVGANGYEARPFYVLEQRHNPNRHQVMLGTLDLAGIMYGVGGWTDDAAPIWDSSTAAQRTANGFWSEDDNTIPSDDVPAKEWR